MAPAHGSTGWRADSRAVLRAKGSLRARRHGRFVRPDRNRPRRPPPGRRARSAAPGPAAARRAGRAGLGPARRPDRPRHVRRRGRGGRARRRRHRRPAVERRAQAGASATAATCPPRCSPVRSPSTACRRSSAGRPRATTATPATGSPSTSPTRRASGFLAEVVPRLGGGHPEGHGRRSTGGAPAHRAWCSPPRAGCSAPLKPVFRFVPGRPARPGHAVHAVDLARRRGRRHRVPAGGRLGRRPGEPHRADARHQRRVHGGARRGGAPAGALRRAGLRDQGWSARWARRCCSTGSASFRRSWRPRATSSGT